MGSATHTRKAIKDHTIANLDYYLDMLATNVEKNGGKVYFARDAADANAYVRGVADKNDVFDGYQEQVNGL